LYPYETEMLERLWFPVAREAEVNAGPVAAELLGRKIVVYRASGGIAAARDRCPHRWARLSLGRTTGDELECPYHGWRFDREGACRLVPSQPGAHPAARLETFPVHSGFGFVWVSIHEPFLAPPEIGEMADPGDEWEIGHGEPFDAGCGLRAITENFRDSSHFAFVHKQTFGDVSPLIPGYTVRRDGWRLAWEFVLRYAGEWQAEGGAGTGSRYRFGGTDADPLDAGVASSQLINYRFCAGSLSYVYTEHPGGGKRIVCQVAAPLTTGAAGCRVFFFVAANAPFRAHYGDVADQVELESRVFAEDVPIVESLDPPEAPLELDGQAHVRADRYSVAYRQLYRELLDEFAAAHQASADAATRQTDRLGV
jgi:phenylpropionate dioxygenase-like ring-hydroxylating dioxygenase large terminal subunit